MIDRSGVFSWLCKPYPFFYNPSRNVLIAIGCGLFIWFVQLFATDASWCHHHMLMEHQRVSAIFGLITFGSILLTFGFLSKVIFGEDRIENWSVKHEFGLIGLLLVVIAVSNFVFVVLASKDPAESFTISVFMGMFLSTVIFGFFPSLFMVWLSYTINLRENLKHARLHNSQLEVVLAKNGVNVHEQRISIPSEIQSETIDMDVNRLLFVRSDGNYLEIYQKNEDQGISVKVFRCSMTKLERELAGFDQLMRTHRSFIVNLRNIARTEGNARNYQLHFKETDQMVPVSRNRFSEFNRRLMESNGHKQDVRSSQALPIRTKLVPVHNNGVASR